MTKRRSLGPLCLICALLLAGTGAHAGAPRQLSWPDLLPKTTVSDNPFARLTKAQLLMLSDIASVRERRARGESISGIDLADEQSATRRLQEAGIDVDGLLAARDKLTQQKRARNAAVNPSLDGQLIRLAGYLLPLEYAGKMVSEFLLVPWVGACIHTPPPPANQIVHVTTDKPVEYGGLFKPVWVTGQIGTTASRKSLFLLDGSSEVDASYSLRALAVEPYQE
jgi:hypothetical protein